MCSSDLKKAISLERQVRIVAGLMVFAGSLLAITNPWWLIVPGFIGAGLAFAGITDTCGMAMILARMPWNQVPQPAAPAAATRTPARATAAGSCQNNALSCCS